MKTLRCAVVAALVLVLCGHSHAQATSKKLPPPKHGPLSTEEHTEALADARYIEEHPLADDAKHERAWLWARFLNDPDINVPHCPGAEPHVILAPPNAQLRAMLTLQQNISGGVFELEHPEQPKDEQAIYLAAVLGELRTYEALVREKPGIYSQMDMNELLKLRDTGKLNQFIHDHGSCKLSPHREG